MRNSINKLVKENVKKTNKKHEYDNSEKNFDLLNNFLNYVSDDMSIIVYDDDDDGSCVIKLYDAEQNYMYTWTNKAKCKKTTDMATIVIDHGSTDSYGVYTVKEKRIHMHTHYANALVERAKELRAVRSILTK